MRYPDWDKYPDNDHIPIRIYIPMSGYTGPDYNVIITYTCTFMISMFHSLLR